MNLVLKEYLIGLNQLRKYINFQDTQKIFIKEVQKGNIEKVSYVNNFLEEYKEFSSNVIFQYNTIIVSMYGYFEAFIEESIKAYLNNFKKYTISFNDMPEKVKENHSFLSALLIQNKNLPKYKEIIKEEEVIINMNSCIIKSSDYNLNVDAYTYHSSNFRKSSIDEFFSKIGIDNISQKILIYPKFKDYLTENEINNINAFDIIDDVAERRNQVAHGADYELLSFEILKEYIDFLQVYGETLINVLTMNIIDYKIKTNRANKIGNVIDNYGKNIIAIKVNTPIKIKKGEQLYAKTNNNNEAIRFGIIESIYVNDVNTEFWENKNGKETDITIKANFKVNEKYEYYVNNV